MFFVRHRVNRIADLQKLNSSEVDGCEIDLRSSVLTEGHIHLSHDAWTQGDSFADWLHLYAQKKFRGPLILNTKEDGLETRALELLKEHDLKNFFFLDTAAPTLVRWTLREAENRFAVRLSSKEPLAASHSFFGKAAWAWVDCFEQKPLPAETVADASRHFKICLVSPELQGAAGVDLTRFKDLLPFATAVCTKQPELWRALAQL